MSQPMMPPDPNVQLLSYLQAWRQYLQQATGGSLLSPIGTPIPASPTDYTQQLLTYLQAWRHYLEQTVGEATGRPSEGDGQPVAPPPYRGEEIVAPADDYGIQTTAGGRPRREPQPAWPDPEPEKPAPPTRHPVGSAYLRFTEAENSGRPAPPAPRSLYSSAAEPGTPRSSYPGFTEPGWLDPEP